MVAGGEGVGGEREFFRRSQKSGNNRNKEKITRTTRRCSRLYFFPVYHYCYICEFYLLQTVQSPPPGIKTETNYYEKK